jgi:hypothetical protein
MEMELPVLLIHALVWLVCVVVVLDVKLVRPKNFAHRGHFRHSFPAKLIAARFAQMADAVNTWTEFLTPVPSQMKLHAIQSAAIRHAQASPLFGMREYLTAEGKVALLRTNAL